MTDEKSPPHRRDLGLTADDFIVDLGISSRLAIDEELPDRGFLRWAKEDCAEEVATLGLA